MLRLKQVKFIELNLYFYRMEMNLNQYRIDHIKRSFNEDEIIILESQMPDHPSSKCSYVAIKPVNYIKAKGNCITTFLNGEKKDFVADPWEALKQFRKHVNHWLFGYLGYDLKNHIEKLKSTNSELISIPDLYFMEPEYLFKVKKNGNVKMLMGPVNTIDISNFEIGYETVDETQSKDTKRTFSVPDCSLKGSKLKSMIDEEEFKSKVMDIQRRIKDGDFYELNYSYPLKADFFGDPYDLYREMRKINPVPFGSFMRLEDISVSCASPERFLRKIGNRIISEPIKGTAERSENPETDEVRRNELLNEKNRAENLMIVDLVRHDLSKIALNGSVQVSKLYDIQTFGTVHQLISTIEAEMIEGLDAVDVIKSCFPMGSMTGAPKIEVMHVIEELEIYKRGLYSGAIGYFDPKGDFDFNVVIRTAIMQNNQLIYPVGGAITSDSNPQLEWNETLIKSRSLTNVFNPVGNL